MSRTRCRWRGCKLSQLHAEGLCQFHYNESQRLSEPELRELDPFLSRDLIDAKVRAAGFVESAAPTVCPGCGKLKEVGGDCKLCEAIDRIVHKMLVSDEDDEGSFKV